VFPGACPPRRFFVLDADAAARQRAKKNVAGTAYLTAWARALGRRIAGDAANGDHLAERVLLPSQRILAAWPRLTVWLLERGLPGAVGYFNARTQYFDSILLREASRGLQQVVILGAGFDSRSLRFSTQLGSARVFDVDMPAVLRLREERLLRGEHPAAVPVAVDFEHDDLATALHAHGYVATARTFFMWEGVSYYLPVESVTAILRLVATHSGPGSGILFDYVTRAFVDGLYTGYGERELARGWRRLGDVNRFGVDDIAAFAGPLGLRVESDVDAGELERRYLLARPGLRLKPWGCMRVAHVVRAEPAYRVES
jgi:methyltransferase (TIGR00027 family)